MKNKKQEKKTNFIIGAGVAAAVAAGIVGFLTQTKQGKKMLDDGKKHAGELAKEVAKRAESMRDMTKKRYEEMVDQVMEDYNKNKKLTQDAADELAKELKKQWAKIQREMKK